jgi:hypothetical protein
VGSLAAFREAGCSPFIRTGVSAGSATPWGRENNSLTQSKTSLAKRDSQLDATVYNRKGPIGRFKINLYKSLPETELLPRVTSGIRLVPSVNSKRTWRSRRIRFDISGDF